MILIINGYSNKGFIYPGVKYPKKVINLNNFGPHFSTVISQFFLEFREKNRKKFILLLLQTLKTVKG